MAPVQLRSAGAGEAVIDAARPNLREQLTLLDLVDRVLECGVVLTGDVTLAVADVDLVYVGLRVLLASVGTFERMAELEAAG